MSLNTQSPGHPGHLLSAAVVAVVVAGTASGSEGGAEPDPAFGFSLANSEPVVGAGAVSVSAAVTMLLSETSDCESVSGAFVTPFWAGSLVAMGEVEREKGIRVSKIKVIERERSIFAEVRSFRVSELRLLEVGYRSLCTQC